MTKADRISDIDFNQIQSCRARTMINDNRLSAQQVVEPAQSESRVVPPPVKPVEAAPAAVPEAGSIAEIPDTSKVMSEEIELDKKFETHFHDYINLKIEGSFLNWPHNFSINSRSTFNFHIFSEGPYSTGFITSIIELNILYNYYLFINQIKNTFDLF